MANTFRTCYTEYVEHMLRYFVKSPVYEVPKAKSKADNVNYMNWQSVQNVWCDLKDSEKSILAEVYGERKGDFRDAVKLAALNHGVGAGDVWKLVTRVSKQVAEMRGLI